MRCTNNAALAALLIRRRRPVSVLRRPVLVLRRPVSVLV